jgi:hypothetical protein
LVGTGELFGLAESPQVEQLGEVSVRPRTSDEADQELALLGSKGLFL